MKQYESRRTFLKNVSLASFSVLALAGCTGKEFDRFFRKNFKALTAEEKAEIIRNLEAEYKEKYGREFQMTAEPALEGVLFGFALDLSRCTGCRKCVYECVKENNQSREPQVHWIQVFQMGKEKRIDFADSNLYYDPGSVPEKDHFYVPVQCQQCENPPCVDACPVKATWQEPDGIIVVDYDWCIGCRYCMAACPYGARHFNWSEPGLPAESLNTELHYLGNRPRMKVVVEKCTLCIQRVRKGKNPACVDICPVGARKFGNILDPDSEVRYIFDNKPIWILKQELNTQPKFYYYFGLEGSIDPISI
jgi:Fe-S-cluster-containing dehydrogenase component